MRRGSLLLVVLLLVAALPATAAAQTENARLDAGAAANWVAGARWDDPGLYTEIPDQVVYPADSHRVMDTLQNFEAKDRVDPAAAAQAVARQQEPHGGFDRFQADLLGPWTGATGYGLFFAAQHDVAIDEEAAVSFVTDFQNEDGGFAPRVDYFGENLPSFMSTTYRVVLGLQASDNLDAETERQVLDFLNDTQTEAGGWPTSLYNPDQTTMTGTWFAARTLIALDALEPETRAQAVEYVLGLEAETGGFASTDDTIKCGAVQCGGGLVCPEINCPDPAGEITTYSTSRAIQLLDQLDALDQTGTTLVDHADWLAARQVQDGYFEGAFRSYQNSPLPTRAPDTPLQPSPWAPFEAPVTHFSLTTSLALDALDSLNATDRADAPAGVDYLVSLQHPTTGGFGWWPGYVSNIPDTSHATRALDALDRLDLAPADRMAEHLSSQQEDSGAITPVRWDNTPRMPQTAQALLALDRVERTDTVDVPAAAGFIADHQTEDGGFQATSSEFADVSIRLTDLAVRALSAVGELDRINQTAAVGYLADHQDEAAISSYSADDGRAALETARALSALSLLESLDAVDVVAAGEHLAGWQADDGTFPTPLVAGAVVNGLAEIGRASALDADQARTYLADWQGPDGSTIPAAFYREENALRQHAIVIEAMATLGGLDSDPTLPCSSVPENGDDPAALSARLDTEPTSLTRGETTTVTVEVANDGVLDQEVGWSLAEAPDGLEVQAPSLDALEPGQTATPAVALAANWTAPTGTHTVTLCASDPGGGHARVSLPVTVQAPPEEQVSLTAEDPVQLEPGASTTVPVTVENTGDDPAEIRFEVPDPAGLETEAPGQTSLAPGEQASLGFDLAAPPRCELPDTATPELRAWGPGGGTALTGVEVNLTEPPAPDVSIQASEPVPVTRDETVPVTLDVVNDGQGPACFDATPTDAPGGFQVQAEPPEGRVGPGQTGQLGLVVDTPAEVDRADPSLGLSLTDRTNDSLLAETSIELEVTGLEAPTVSAETPLEAATGTRTTTAIVGEPIEFRASAQDPDGSVERVLVYPQGLGGDPVETQAYGSTHIAEVTYDEPGPRSVAVAAVDDHGQTSLARVDLGVVANEAPRFDLADVHANATGPSGARVDLAVNATDPESRPLARDAHAWHVSSGEIVGQAGDRVDVQAPVGVHPVQASVTDANGAQATASADVVVDDALQLDAVPLFGGDYQATQQASIAVQAVRDDGAPAPGPVWINVTHADTGQQVSSVAHVPSGTVETVEIPYDVGSGPVGFNLPGEHEVTIETHADSRPIAPIQDVETASLALGYQVQP